MYFTLKSRFFRFVSSPISSGSAVRLFLERLMYIVWVKFLISEGISVNLHVSKAVNKSLQKEGGSYLSMSVSYIRLKVNNTEGSVVNEFGPRS